LGQLEIKLTIIPLIHSKQSQQKRETNADDKPSKPKTTQKDQKRSISRFRGYFCAPLGFLTMNC